MRPINSRFSVIFEKPVVAGQLHNLCFNSSYVQVEVGIKAQSHNGISAVASATIGSDSSRSDGGENAMKRFLFAGVGSAVLLGMVAPALAADMAVKAPPPVVAPIYSWAGFYIGGNGGWGSSHKCWDVTNFPGRKSSPSCEGCHDATGGTVGGQIGYRWQASNWVFGLEAQGNWADLTGSNVSVFIPRWTNNSKIEAFGLFTGQVGYAWNNVLWYVKGGAAVTDDTYRGTVSPTSPFQASCSMMCVKHGGVVSSERASNSDLHRTGRLRSSTITCSWETTVRASRRQVFWVQRSYRSAAYSAPTPYARTWT